MNISSNSFAPSILKKTFVFPKSIKLFPKPGREFLINLI